jgi:prophage antirepressor-like protein
VADAHGAKTSYLIQVSGSNYKANTLFVNESGLYALILSSKLQQAKAFPLYS